MRFEVIKGMLDQKEQVRLIRIEKMKSKWFHLYLDYKYGLEHQPESLKAIYFGVKFYSKLKVDELNYNQLLVALSEFSDIKMMIAATKLKDLTNIFSIIKDYDGEKYGCKDYYTTKQYLDEKNLDDIVGVDGVEDFLWHYYNNDIMNFSVKEMLVMDRIMKHEGRLGLMESFLKNAGLEEKIHTYTFDQSKNIMYDNVTGESFTVKKPTPRETKYFKVIEGTNGNND